MVTAGVIVRGVIHLNISPMIPVTPRKTWKREATQMAPCISLILLCQTSVLSVSLLAPPATDISGHLPFRLRMARVGTRKAKVPPWMMGRRHPKVACSKVMMPETKSIVEMM